MATKYVYYVRKFQGVTSKGCLHRQATLRRTCRTEDGRLLWFFYIPFLVQHMAYEIAALRQACGVYGSQDVDREATCGPDF